VALNEKVTVEAEGDLGLDNSVLNLLATKPVTIWTGTELPYPGRFDRLIVHLSLHHEGLFTITAPRDFLPGALRAWNVIYAIAWGETVAHLRLRAVDPADPKIGNQIGVSAYGPQAAGLAERLAEDVRSWGRIWELDPDFEVYPNTADADLDASEAILLQKRHSRIRITWPLAESSTAR
jgi:protein-L-isoaspartate(D-aspartate) O-methyltransferase